MRATALAVLGLLAAFGPALAQEAEPKSDDQNLAGGSSGGTLGQLLSRGYEIKAAVPNGTRYIVFVQKDQSAFACEFVSLAKSRCGSIN
ncbi:MULTISPECIES: hypothetical protein [unclassified Rhizobium]|uniref:hypothetical protein n=1 Tax=unclassified Rhizobium TaxID=2613769 RepID=UPI000712A22A|nr:MULTISPECIES: hypothetical protein [unclassified Rhizobium]KQS93875.1 hypothetical protein ASG50_07130 [Rhizobium sp. Leaf386]KQT06608.1 hypothetical protein ASG42_03250 [Rhizobium sp. Leaf391]KQU05037.1 hypothetical protein ASG68_26110 [Rhizobium sp. Leaf453]